MALPTWEVTDGGIDGLQVMFERIAEAADDQSEPMRNAAEAVKYEIMMNFETEGSFTDEGRWQELSPKYAHWKHVSPGRFAGEPILQMTTELLRDAAEAELEWWDGGATVTIDNPLAYTHQFGRQNSRPMPARPLVDFAPSTLEDISDGFNTWLQDAMEDMVQVSGYSYERHGKTINVGGYWRRR